MGVTRARERLELLTYREKFGEPGEAGTSFVRQLLGEAGEPQERLTGPSPRSKPEAGPTAEQIAA